MYCNCYRNNPDEDIRRARRDYFAEPNSYEALERWISACMRAGQVPVELLIPAIKKLEIQAENTIYDQLRQDPSYQRKSPRDRWEKYESVEVYHPSEWQPRSYIYSRVSFGPRGESSFHLGPCGRCNLPSWQQPCPWCGFYPMGSADYIKQPRTREDFLRRLQRYPNFFHFYAQDQASGRVPQWAPIAARIRDEMLRLGQNYQWPTHEEIWDYYQSGGFGWRFPWPPEPTFPETLRPIDTEDEGPAYRRNGDSVLRSAQRAVQTNLNDVDAWHLLLRHAERAGKIVYVRTPLERTLKPGRGSILGALGGDIMAVAKVEGIRDSAGPVLDIVCVDPYFRGLRRGLRLSQIHSVEVND